MSSWFNRKTEKRVSPIQGRGLFAREAISAGDIVAVKGGTIIGATAFALIRDSLQRPSLMSQLVRGDTRNFRANTPFDYFVACDGTPYSFK
jgi:hypothetical protein